MAKALEALHNIINNFGIKNENTTFTDMERGLDQSKFIVFDITQSRNHWEILHSYATQHKKEWSPSLAKKFYEEWEIKEALS